MTESFTKIDYSLRPAKYAERRMLCDIFGRLRPFQSPEEYVYVGLGSVWFSDFALFHRVLGIRQMISIERAARARARVEANKPFRNITVEYRTSSSALPDLDWKRRHIIWLDYDDPIDPGMLFDTRTVAAHARSGTVLALSVQCHKAREAVEAERESDVSAINRFQTRFGRERVSDEVLEDDLSGWRLGTLSRAMFRAEITDTLAKRNLLLSPAAQIKFFPICDFEYADGAKMTTVVGLFVSAEDRPLARACAFSNLDFLPQSGKLLRIKVPILTSREMRHLERQLPKATSDPWELGSIPAKEAKLFADFYRYFPNFAAVEH